MPIAGGHEIILVNDGSRDETEQFARQLIETSAIPIRFISLSRNFGNIMLSSPGSARAPGNLSSPWTTNLQNPPSEVPKLLQVAQSEKRDVVYSAYEKKEHAGWRNLGSRLTNALADWSIDKPKGLYLSSFRCISRFVADEIAKSSNSSPYIDGLIFQVTQNVGVVTVRHDPRAAGTSGYTLRALLRLWMSMLINASVMPLRIATLIGIAMSLIGFVSFIAVFINHFINQEPLGWGSQMAALLLFSGTQLLLLGLVGEYVGRTYLRVSEKPQSIVRYQTNNSKAVPPV